MLCDQSVFLNYVIANHCWAFQQFSESKVIPPFGSLTEDCK